MIDDGIKRLIHTKQHTGHANDHYIKSQNKIPGIYTLFLGKIDRNKIRTARSCVHEQTDADHESIDDTAEDTDQQNIISDRHLRNDVCQHTRQYDHQAGVQRKLLADKPESYVDWYQIQQQVYQRIGDFHAQKPLKDTLDQNCQSRGATRIQPARLDKCFDIDCHNNRCQADNDDPLTVLFQIKGHIAFPP